MKKTMYLLFAMSVFNSIYIHSISTQNKGEIERLENLLVKRDAIKVTATMYNAVKGQCDEDPLVTAGMFKINPHRASEHKWIAVSRDLLKKNGGEFQYGDKVKLMGAGEKDGIYTIADTMNKRYRKRIDILETKGTPLYKYENVLLAKI